MGPDRLERIKIFAGDVVERKKPHPDIYNLAKVVFFFTPLLEFRLKRRMCYRLAGIGCSWPYIATVLQRRL